MKFIAICSVTFALLNQVFAKPAAGCLQVYTVTDNDDCYSVAQRFQLSEPEFYAMNPGLHHNPQHMCDNLDTGKPYCVCMNTPCVSDASSSMNNTTHATASTNATPTTATERVHTAAPTLVRFHVAGSHSVSHSNAYPTAIPLAANSTHLHASFSASASSSYSSNATPTTRPSGTTTPITNSLQNAETSGSLPAMKALKTLVVGFVMASTFSLF